MLVEGKTHNGGVELNPAVHLVPAHIAHHVIDVEQAGRTSQMVLALLDVSGEKRAVIILALDKGVDRVAVNGGGCSSKPSVFFGMLNRLLHAARPATGRLFPGQPGVIYPKRDIANSVAVKANMLSSLIVGPQRGSEDK